MRFLIAIIIQTSLNISLNPKLQTCVMAKNGNWDFSSRKFSTFQESLDFTSLFSCFMYFIRKIKTFSLNFVPLILLYFCS